jgi:hypothetical protein
MVLYFGSGALIAVAASTERIRSRAFIDDLEDQSI